MKPIRGILSCYRLGRFTLTSIYRAITFYIIFQAFFCFLVTGLHLLKYVQSLLSSRPGWHFYLNNAIIMIAYSGQT